MARQVEPGSAKPAWVREPFEFVDLIGRRSADSIRAARRFRAGRIHGCTRRCIAIADKPLGKRGTSIHEPTTPWFVGGTSKGLFLLVDQILTFRQTSHSTPRMWTLRA